MNITVTYGPVETDMLHPNIIAMYRATVIENGPTWLIIEFPTMRDAVCWAEDLDTNDYTVSFDAHTLGEHATVRVTANN